jgi:hypothetical protein
LRKLLLAGAIALALTPAVANLAGAKGANPAGKTGTIACNNGTVSWTPAQTWPPNHKPITIHVSYHDADTGANQGAGAGDTSVDVKTATVVGDTTNGSGKPTNQDVTISENAKTAGNDDGSADATDDGLQVLSERSGHDIGGRTYVITAECQDSGGADGTMPPQTVTFCVSVPHDQHHAIEQPTDCGGVVG